MKHWLSLVVLTRINFFIKITLFSPSFLLIKAIRSISFVNCTYQCCDDSPYDIVNLIECCKNFREKKITEICCWFDYNIICSVTYILSRSEIKCYTLTKEEEKRKNTGNSRSKSMKLSMHHRQIFPSEIILSGVQKSLYHYHAQLLNVVKL